jgi:hypothetical protein
MVARYEDAFAFSDMNLLIAIVENHLTRIDVIDGIFAGTMYAAAEVIIEEAVEYIVVIEDKLHLP